MKIAYWRMLQMYLLSGKKHTAPYEVYFLK